MSAQLFVPGLGSTDLCLSPRRSVEWSREGLCESLEHEQPASRRQKRAGALPSNALVLLCCSSGCSRKPAQPNSTGDGAFGEDVASPPGSGMASQTVAIRNVPE